MKRTKTQLRKNYMKAVFLYRQGLSFREIGMALGVSGSTAHRWYKRGVATFKDADCRIDGYFKRLRVQRERRITIGYFFIFLAFVAIFIILKQNGVTDAVTNLIQI